MYKPSHVAHSLQIDTGRKDLLSPPGIQRSPGLDLRVELAQVLNVPGVRDIVTLREL
jgi:hypothetical protein